MKTLLIVLAMALGTPAASPLVQEGTKQDPRVELIQKLKALSKELKTATDPKERKRLESKIAAVKEQLALLSEPGKKPSKAPSKPDPKAELQAELNRLYREFKETSDPAVRTRLRNDISLVMAALKKLAAGEESKQESASEIETLRWQYQDLVRKVGDASLSKTERKKAKAEASDIKKRIDALQRTGKESPKKAPKKPK